MAHTHLAGWKIALISLRKVPPEDVLPAGDAQGGGHGLSVEREFQHQPAAPWTPLLVRLSAYS